MNGSPIAISFDTLVYDNIGLDFINGSPVYGNLSTYTSGLSSEIPFYSSYIINATSGDTLEVVGEKNINEPNFLQRNPIYGFAVTKLEVISI